MIVTYPNANLDCLVSVGAIFLPALTTVIKRYKNVYMNVENWRRYSTNLRLR